MEQRLIDANALKESFRKQTVNVQGKIKDDADAIIEAICKDVDLAPTVDAVPIRCKDCKYCYEEGFVNVRNVCEKHYDFGNVDDDWFCADGERRSDD